MHSDVRKILRLQSCDLEKRALKLEIATLPKHIAAIEKQLDSHLRKLEADQAALAANQRERKRLELQVQEHEQKISRLKTQMLEASTNEQYRAFQHEISHWEGEIRKTEDKILELMEASETLEGNVRKADVALAAEKKQVEGEKTEARRRTDNDRKRLAEVEAAREEIVESLSVDMVASYNRIAKKWKNGLVAVEVKDGICGGCMLILRPQLFQDVKKSDAVMLCENCGRIIYYNPPESFEGDIASGGGPTPIRRIS
jgi:uncharacterized protein